MPCRHHARMTLFTMLLVPLMTATLSAAPQTQPSIKWENWSDDVFARARKEHKFVLMDLEAVWCHWCHVMDHVTYSDPEVVRLINEKYIAVKVDQDARPDISNKYEDFGWPATVVFNGDGGEIVKRQGYLPPKPMARMLQAIIDDPTPGPSVQPEKEIEYGSAMSLDAQTRNQLQREFDGNYDATRGGWGTIHKYLDWDAIEWSMIRARAGDKQAESRARQTLTAALKLIDPAWGGIYQYSTDGDWDHPHFEKIMQFQAEAIRIYALAWEQWHDPAYLHAAQSIQKYLSRFLTSPEGAFYTSQDADLIDGVHSASYFALDDSGRSKLGLPRVDKHVYARENGWAIEGLVALYKATSERAALNEATHAARWIVENRSIERGGFHHGDHDPAGPYLGDSLAMGRAFLALNAATNDHAWLDRARLAGDFIDKHFRAPEGMPGFVTAAGSKPDIDENVYAARFFNSLARCTRRTSDREAARRAMKFLATPQIGRSRGAWGAGVLLADAELTTDVK